MTVAHAREADRRATAEFGIPSVCLMENAGAGAARLALESTWDLRSGVICICGPGGNGGDAMVVARHLAIASVPVTLLFAEFAGKRLADDTRTQVAICAALRLPSQDLDSDVSVDRARTALSGAGVIVDGLVGTGLDRPLGGLSETLVRAACTAGPPVLALDVPSGLDADTGIPRGACIRAAVTATFVAPKAGFANPASREWTGDVRVVPIGAPATWPPA